MPGNSDNIRGTQFKKGVSGNPSGRPKGSEGFFAECRKLSPEALQALKRGLSDPDNYIQAAKVILENAWGKPRQAIDLDASEGLVRAIIQINKGSK